jgi:hypothetical protein
MHSYLDKTELSSVQDTVEVYSHGTM